MKVTLISTSTYPSDQGIRTISAVLKKEGHEVKYYIKSPEFKDSANGFVDKVEDWEKEFELINSKEQSTNAKIVKNFINNSFLIVLSAVYYMF